MAKKAEAKKEEEVEETGKVIPFQPQVITGGKEPPHENWLKHNVGSGRTFLFRSASRNPRDPREIGAGMAQKLKEEDCGFTLLCAPLEGNKLFWIQSLGFSRQNDLLTVLDEYEVTRNGQELDTIEPDAEQRDRPNPP